MARMKTWWLDKLHETERPTRFQRFAANLRSFQEMGARTPRLANAVAKRKFFRRRLGIASARHLPGLARRPLTKDLPTGLAGPLLYPDCFTTFQDPEIGIAASRLIPGLQLAPAGCCGRVMLSEGFVSRAKQTAEAGAIVLRSTTGPILFAEPSCMSAVTDDWPHLIGDVSDIAARCELVESHVDKNVTFRGGGRVLFHPHCHQRALWGTEATEAALRLVPDLEIEIPDSGCCGMAGGFGYRADRYELSVAMAERVLAPAVRATNSEVVATGTSCRHQVADLTLREAVHPVVFLAGRVVR
jgi:Fe-S oxidoreductase